MNDMEIKNKLASIILATDSDIAQNLLHNNLPEYFYKAAYSNPEKTLGIAKDHGITYESLTNGSADLSNIMNLMEDPRIFDMILPFWMIDVIMLNAKE